jgi:DNA-binding MarR family transcriptional regulator
VAASIIPDNKDSSDSPGRELRSVASRLLALADTIDEQDQVEPGMLSPILHERDQLLLLRVWAEAEYRGRRKREDFIPDVLLGEPAWDILLTLYIRDARRKPATVSSLCEAAAVCDTTALRGLRALEEERLVKRLPGSDADGVEIVRLTESGVRAVSDWLRYRAALLA